MSAQPLDGVRVLDLTRLLPGAYLTLILADLGADVVKIEDPRGGDPGRALPPVAGGTTAYFQVLNRNKRSVTLDLRSPGAAAVLDALLSRFDVVVESFRPQTARRLGVDAAILCARHPRLVHVSLTGFGQTGPSSACAAHDLNFEALSGLLMVRGTGVVSTPAVSDKNPPENDENRGRESFPAVPRMLIGDIGAATHAAAGLLAALYQRERTGAGAAVEVSIHEAALSWLLVPAARTLVAGDDPDAIDLPTGGEHACYNVYRTADDRYLALGALEAKFWATFCARIGRDDLVALQYVPGAEQARVLADVRALIRSRTRDEWLALFSGLDVCLTPVNSVAEALGDPHIAARGAVVRHDGSTYITTPIVVTHATTGDARQVARRVQVRSAPALGAHTDEVLRDAGLAAADIARLRDRRVI
jgi:alpha-methylacyl-CoA racemase